MPSHETRTDSPGDTLEVPSDPCQHWRIILSFRHRLHTRSRPWHRWERNPVRPSNNSHGEWPFLRPPDLVPEVPVISREYLSQLETMQEVLPSRRDEAHFRGGVSRLINLASGTSKGSFTPLLQLKKFPDVPVFTREEARESCPHPEEPRFRLIAREEESFPCVFRERIPGMPVASQEEALSTGNTRGSPGS